MTRHWYAWQALGNLELFATWPADRDDLTPADDPSWPSSGLVWEDRSEMWQIAAVDHIAHPNIWGLYTFVDLTADEEARIADTRFDLGAVLEDRRSRVQPILEAIADQITEMFDVSLPERLDARLEQMRRTFSAREGVAKTIAFDDKWLLPVPQVEAGRRSVAASRLSAVGAAIPMTSKLSPASFDDVQRVIRVWADGIQRYPRAFRDLNEDPISDLLAATLNATLPGAQREVYRRGGKTDIFIQADVLGPGLGVEKVFIAESKWARSKKTVQEALDPQLFGYLTAVDTAAVLLLLFRQKNFAEAEREYQGHLRDVRGFVGATEGITGWPIYNYERDGRNIAVCVASVSVADVV